jgi:hypothetical protein
MGKNQEFDGAMAPTPRLLDNDREEKDINYYTEHPHKCTVNSKDNEPQKPFGVTFTTSRNLLQQAFRTQ